MKVISLSYDEAGYACSIGSSIKKKYNLCTNFFDYLIVDINTINQILNLTDFNLLKFNFEYENQKEKKNITLIWKNFNKLISYHDLKCNFSKEDLDNMIKKYIRRYFRLMNDIFSEKIIFFIRYGKTDKNEIKSFINYVKKINNKLIIYFINVDYDINFKHNISYEDIDNYIYINFYDINPEKNEINDPFYRILNCNWEFIFQIIENANSYYK